MASVFSATWDFIPFPRTSTAAKDFPSRSSNPTLISSLLFYSKAGPRQRLGAEEGVVRVREE